MCHYLRLEQSQGHVFCQIVGGKAEDLGTQNPPERPKSDSSVRPFKMPTKSKPPSSLHDHIPAAKYSKTAGRRIMVMQSMNFSLLLGI